MIKHIATDADAHVRRSNIIIFIYIDMIIVGEDGDSDLSDDTEHSLVGMSKYYIVNKPTIMRQTLSHISFEFISEIYRPAAQIIEIRRCLSCDDTPLYVF